MSYDLMVFDSDLAPKQRTAFLEWYEQQTEWNEGHEYHDSRVSTPRLRAWFSEMIETIPPLNGPFAHKELPLPPDDLFLSDYSVGHTMIYVGFAWSKVEHAYSTVFRLAAKHAVGFFDVSSDKSEIWLPDGKGELILAHSD